MREFCGHNTEWFWCINSFRRIMVAMNYANYLFKRRRFDRDIIILCVCWYVSYKLSYRDLVEMMAERGLSLSHTIISVGPSGSCHLSRHAFVDTRSRLVNHGAPTKRTLRSKESGFISTEPSTKPEKRSIFSSVRTGIG